MGWLVKKTCEKLSVFLNKFSVFSFMLKIANFLIS